MTDDDLYLFLNIRHPVSAIHHPFRLNPQPRVSSVDDHPVKARVRNDQH